MEAQIEQFYPKAGTGRRPYPLSTMFRIHCLQQWYTISDPAMVDALYEITSMRLLAELSLDSAIPDYTTIMNFRHLLVKHQLSRTLFMEVNKWLSEADIYLKEGTLVDATILEAPTSIINKEGKRDPDMHQTKKWNQWNFGMKAHIGVDERTGLTHTFTSTNEHDLNQTKHLIHGDEAFIGADSGYRGAQKRKELKDVTVQWLIVEMSSKTKALKKHPRININPIKTEFTKASIRAKVENPFRIIKCQFGFVKARYRGLAKNDNKLAMLFALANVEHIDKMIRAARG